MQLALCFLTLAFRSAHCAWNDAEVCDDPADRTCASPGGSMIQKKVLTRASDAIWSPLGPPPPGCKGFCARNPLAWDAKCNWPACSLCDECTPDPTEPAPTGSPETAPPTLPPTDPDPTEPAPEPSNTKYPLVGCMSKNAMDMVTRSVALTTEGIESCLDTCKTRGFVFGGFMCPGERLSCYCWAGAPWENYWASPHHQRYSNKAEQCVEHQTPTDACPGHLGDYFLGSANSVSVYGLESADAYTSSDGYTPVAEIPRQPPLAQPSLHCETAGGSPLSDLTSNGQGADDVVVPAGQTYYVDSHIVVGKVVVEENAVLYFRDGADVVLSANSIVVRGTLRLGTEECPLGENRGTSQLPAIGIVLTGPKPAVPVREDKAIVVESGGTLDIWGFPYAPTWTRLKASAVAGSDTIQLQESVNWQAGHEVLVVTTRHVDEKGDHQNEVRTIKAVNDDTVTFTEPLRFFHYGGPEYQAEVALLSRSVRIDGDEQSDSEEFGGHTICLRGAVCRLNYVRGHKLGQKNVMGSYPFHFHMMGSVSGESRMAGLAVTGSYFRAFTIHGTSDCVLSRSVAFNIQGSAVYLEDGIEERNLIEHNLVAHVHPIAPPPKPWVDYQSDSSGTQAIETIPERIVPTDLTPACFYCTNPNNRWIGNAASGGFSGFTFPMLPKVVGLSASENQDYKPVEQDLLEFDGNSCHSAGQWFGNGACLYAGGTLKNIDSNASHYWYWFWKFGSDENYRGQMTFKNVKFFANRAGLKSWGLKHGRRPAVKIVNAEFHDNMLALAFFGHNALENAVITGHTENYAVFPTYTPVHGFQTYDTTYQTIMTDVVFRGFQGPYDYALYNFVVADCCTPMGLLGVKGLSFVDVPWERRIVLNPHEMSSSSLKKRAVQWANDQDVDGSLTGIDGGAILGAADNNDCDSGQCGTFQWWRMDDTCQRMFKDHEDSRGYWACPKLTDASPDVWGPSEHRRRGKRTVVALIGVEGAPKSKGRPSTVNGVTYYPDAPSCSGNNVLKGSYYHFGHEDRRVSFGWTSQKGGKLITGSCCDVGWYLDMEGENPTTVTLMLEQMVPEGGLIWATTYPAEATITIQKCFGVQGDKKSECAQLEQASTKREFLQSSAGTLIMIDDSNTVFLKLVNERNTWFGEHVLASQWVEEARYIITSSIAGEVEMALPAADWASTDLD